MKVVFADTFYWIALINPRDSSNSRVLALSRSLDAGIVTTDEVLTELLTFCSDPELRAEAALAFRTF